MEFKMVQMCIVSGGNVLIQRVVNDLGTVALAANTAAGRIENYMAKQQRCFAHAAKRCGGTLCSVSPSYSHYNRKRGRFKKCGLFVRFAGTSMTTQKKKCHLRRFRTTGNVPCAGQ
jgi:hypothetical protein